MGPAWDSNTLTGPRARWWESVHASGRTSPGADAALPCLSGTAAPAGRPRDPCLRSGGVGIACIWGVTAFSFASEGPAPPSRTGEAEDGAPEPTGAGGPAAGRDPAGGVGVGPPFAQDSAAGRGNGPRAGQVCKPTRGQHSGYRVPAGWVPFRCALAGAGDRAQAPAGTFATASSSGDCEGPVAAAEGTPSLTPPREF